MFSSSLARSLTFVFNFISFSGKVNTFYCTINQKFTYNSKVEAKEYCIAIMSRGSGPSG